MQLFVSISLLIALQADPIVIKDPPVIIKPGACSPLLGCWDHSCQPTPGEVDRSAFYWKMKLVKQGPILNYPIWVLNDDPTACEQAVAHNLERLAEFYGKRPEISAPNAALLRTLADLEVPSLAPLASTDAVVEDDPQQTLLLRIRETEGRLASLTPRIDWHESFVSTTSVWADALAAGERLDSRAAGMDDALSAAATWPVLEEYAVATWKLAVCNSLKADRVAELTRRFENGESMSAWSFAFAEDWNTFTRPFGTLGLGRFGSLGLPFFVEAVEVAADRQEKSLFTQRDVREFRTGVANLTSEVGLLVAHRLTQQSAALEGLRTAFASEVAVVAILRAALEDKANALDAKKGELDHATAARDQLAAEITQQRTDLADADRRFAVSREASRSAQARHELARAATSKARERMGAAQAQLEAIVLDCGGPDYASCPDEAAKLAYDRRRYEAQDVLVTTRQEFMDALTLEIAALEAVARAEQQAIDRQEEAAAQRIGLAELLGLVDGAAELVTRLGDEWRTLETDFETLRTAMVPVEHAVASIAPRIGA